ncbi:DUF4064 domain-containing protein [Listeria costaricensis]|uniref:DUF4064 domain-containing protein n=1 Tax=Listeria costaricensis TaxID=2026604 RepID=UPI000C068133|nr:DUF4064 domain-containing protein [Listeria costaricensis]
MNLRKAEFILSLLAGITGIIAGLFRVSTSALATALVSISAEDFLDLGASTTDVRMLATTSLLLIIPAILSTIIGAVLFIFAFILRKNAKVFGILILVLGAVGFFLLGLLWIVPGVLAIIAGIMCLARKVPTEF